jgi:hypothetical protein
MTSIFTLDPTTLFYFNLSRDGPTESDRLSEWFKKTNTSALGGGLVAKNTRLPSLGHSSHASSALHPSTATTSGRSAIQAIVHVKPTSNYGGISDPDERVGPEQARARASPAKGKRRLNSDVSTTSTFFRNFRFLLINFYKGNRSSEERQAINSRGAYKGGKKKRSFVVRPSMEKTIHANALPLGWVSG